MGRVARRRKEAPAVSKKAYRRASGQERRQVAEALRNHHEIDQKIGGALGGVIAQVKDLERTCLVPEAAPAYAALMRTARQLSTLRPQQPLHLLACAHCGNLTPQCTCLGLDGKPLDWGFKKAMG